MNPTTEQLEALAVSEAEYEAIVERLGRQPNELELGLFGSLWSEHCGYKHSKLLLATLPSSSHRLLVAPGVENAGAIDIGDGLALVMKIESHNHPSAIEPYEGAATGVGGIVRDIFAMGARPIALLNSLRFGPLTEPRNRFLFNGVVSGISGYGNCIGVPNVGGEVVFSESYSGNPLVNAMCIGLLATDGLVRATTGEPGNSLVLVGSETGKDGIHGASGLASRNLDEDREMRPTVQVGNPFLEKVLIEACLEAAATGKLAGMQDLGAAGLTSAAIEAASKGGTGITIDVSLVPRREQGMEPYHVMLSESQERMLIVAAPEYVDEVRAVFDRWGLQSTVIGRSTGDGLVRVFDGGERCGEAPIALLTDPPQYRPQGVKPAWLDKLQIWDADTLPIPEESPETVLEKLLASPNIASKEPVFRRYDHQVQTNTVVTPGGDSAVLRLKGTRKGIAAATDGNGRYCFLDPYEGGKIAVAEACRNVSCSGAEPVALTDCLNFGNPERPEIFYQLEMCVRGISDAASALGVPVISGNVSLYNESEGAVYPTPIIGGLGLLEDVRRHATIAFQRHGDLVYLLGRSTTDEDAGSLGGSEYLTVVHSLVAGRLTIDLDLEVAVQRACRRLIEEGVARSAHDCSDGGLSVALAESCISGSVGLTSELSLESRWDAVLFGEGQSRIVVSVSPGTEQRLLEVCRNEGVPAAYLGVVGGDRLIVDGLLDAPIADLASAWKHGLREAASGSSA